MPGYLSSSTLNTMLYASGIPSSITATDLGYHVATALERYSKIRPLYAVYNLALAADTQDYALPSTWTEIKHLFYTPMGYEVAPSQWVYPPNWWRIGVGDMFVFDQPSLGYLWMDKYARMVDFFKGTYELYEAEDDEGELQLWLRLIPPPEQSQTMKLMGRLLRSTSQVRSDDKEIFTLCVKIQSLQALIDRQGLGHSVSDTGWNVDIGGSVKFYQEQIQEAEIRLFGLTADTAAVERGY